MNVLLEKFKEVSYSVIAISILVLLLSFTILSIETVLLIRFFIGALLIVVGLGIFLWGTDLGISQIGSHLGREIALSDSSYFVFFSGLILGFLISVAEPDLLILAEQVSSAMNNLISAKLIVISVSIGVGIMIGFGFLRILFDWNMSKCFMWIYLGILLALTIIAEPFHSIAFDASGATTGAMTTPFILSLGLGVAALKGSSDGEKDSFGLVGFASSGPIMAVMILSIVLGVKEIHGQAEIFVPDMQILSPFINSMVTNIKEAIIALLPIFLVFLIVDKRKLHLPKKEKRSIVAGMLYTLIGLVLFLVGVQAGFMDFARVMGQQLALFPQKNILLPLLGFVLGMVVVLAEPAVYVLANQVEDVSSGYINRKVILLALSIGVAIAVSLSMVRILLVNLKLWMFLVPGFLIAIFLARKTDQLFVGIAFDSGGVASGPMTATFILALAQGVAETIPHANVLNDGFGIIAMVAMTPIIMILIVGQIFMKKSKKEGIPLE